MKVIADIYVRYKWKQSTFHGVQSAFVLTKEHDSIEHENTPNNSIFLLKPSFWAIMNLSDKILNIKLEILLFMPKL